MKQFAVAVAVLLSPAISSAKAPAAPAAAPVVAARAMVSAADPRAAAAGVEMLKAGGSAMDAVAATVLALTVVEPQSSGIGGGGLLVYQTAGGRTPATFDGREKAPLAATDRLFLDAAGLPLPARGRDSRRQVGRRSRQCRDAQARARQIRQAAVGGAVPAGDPARPRRL